MLRDVIKKQLSALALPWVAMVITRLRFTRRRSLLLDKLLWMAEK